MTTPTPFATALRGLVAFVRSKCPTRVIDGDVVCLLCVDAVDKCVCSAAKARAALAAWESRGALSADQALLESVASVLAGRSSVAVDDMGPHERLAFAEDAAAVLQRVDRALTGERGP